MQFLQRQKSRFIHFSDGIRSNTCEEHEYSDYDENEFHFEVLPDYFPSCAKSKDGVDSFRGEIQEDYEGIINTRKY